MPKKALVIVDMLNDFVNKYLYEEGGRDGLRVEGYEGKLVVPDAQEIIENIFSLREYAAANNILVVYANDAHAENDLEFRTWSVHALKGTYGAKVTDELEANKSDIIIEKQSLSMFSNKTADSKLRTYGIEELIITGVATEYCVRAAVLEGRELGYKVNVVVDAIAGVEADKGDCGRALIEMGNVGARPVYTHEVLENMI